MSIFNSTVFPDFLTITLTPSGTMQASGVLSGFTIGVTNAVSIIGTPYVSTVSDASAVIKVYDKTGTLQSVMTMSPTLLTFNAQVAAFSMVSPGGATGLATITFNTGGSASTIGDNTVDTNGLLVTIPSTSGSRFRVKNAGGERLLLVDGNTNAVTTANNTLDDGTNGNIIALGNVQIGNAGTAAAHLYSGSGAPSFSAASGDYYIRTDTPSSANQRIYVNTASGNHWSGIV